MAVPLSFSVLRPFFTRLLPPPPPPSHQHQQQQEHSLARLQERRKRRSSKEKTATVTATALARSYFPSTFYLSFFTPLHSHTHTRFFTLISASLLAAILSAQPVQVVRGMEVKEEKLNERRGRVTVPDQQQQLQQQQQDATEFVFVNGGAPPSYADSLQPPTNENYSSSWINQWRSSFYPPDSNNANANVNTNSNAAATNANSDAAAVSDTIIKLGSGGLAGVLVGSGLRFMSRSLIAGTLVASGIIVTLQQNGYIQIQWRTVREKWNYLFNTRQEGSSLIKELKRRIQHWPNSPPPIPSREERAAENSNSIPLENILLAVERWTITVLLTAPGIGFVLGVAWAIRR